MNSENKKVILIGITAIFLFAFVPMTIAQEVPAHVVISEVYPDPTVSAKGEFVELYNPTDNDIVLTGCKLEDNDGKSCTLSGTIPCHGFYLVVYNNTEYKIDNASWPDADNTNLPYYFLANAGDELRLKDSTEDIIDTVGYGSAAGLCETSPAPVPDKGKSIERKSLSYGYAPCQDTNNNSFDFFVQDTPTPMNSSSQKWIPHQRQYQCQNTTSSDCSH